MAGPISEKRDERKGRSSFTELTRGRPVFISYVGARQSAEKVERKQIPSVSPQLVVIVSSRNLVQRKKLFLKFFDPGTSVLVFVGEEALLYS